MYENFQGGGKFFDMFFQKNFQNGKSLGISRFGSYGFNEPAAGQRSAMV